MLSEQTRETIMLVFILLIVVGMFYVLVKFFVDRCAPVKTVTAKIVAKNRVESFSKYAGSGKSYRYVIVFEAAGKKMSFYVSEFSYGGYRIGEKGTLQYKGSRIVNFH